jgi:hypothetical protein
MTKDMYLHLQTQPALTLYVFVRAVRARLKNLLESAPILFSYMLLGRAAATARDKTEGGNKGRAESEPQKKGNTPSRRSHEVRTKVLEIAHS